MKTIAVLGGSHLQYNFINSALKLGHDILVLDGNPNCLVSGDKRVNFFPIDFSNIEKVRKLVKEKDVDLVYSPSTETGNMVSAKLATDFSYKYNSISTVRRTIDKVEQRALKGHLSLFKTPNWKIVSDYNSDIGGDYKYPLIIKVNNSSGGRGILKVEEEKNFKNSLNEVKNYLKRDSKVLIEEFIQGKQYSIETISINGEHYIYAITEEIIGEEPNFIERSHFMSPDLYHNFKPMFQTGVVELLNALKVEYGSCHIEVIVDHKGKVYLVEIASRTGGLRDYLADYAGHTNYNQLLIDVHLNNKLDVKLLTPPKNEALVNILTYVDDLHAFIKGKKDGVLQSWHFNNKGPSENPTSLVDAYGYAYFKSNFSLKKYGLK